MKTYKIPWRLISFFSIVMSIALVVGVVSSMPAKDRDYWAEQNDYDKDMVARQTVFRGDDVTVHIKGLPQPFPTKLPYGPDYTGQLFDGYPQIIKTEIQAPTYKVKVEKNVMVTLRDGVRIAVDIYHPDAGGQFPTILAWGTWLKDLQEAVAWMQDKPQIYYDSPLWDGTMEGGNYTYTVPRGFVHVIPDPRGQGNSEGYGTTGPAEGNIPAGTAGDIYELIEWIAAQPWSDGKVGMMGPSAFSISQNTVGPYNPPHLVALHADEAIWGISEEFHGMLDLTGYHITSGRHGNDAGPVAPNYDWTVRCPTPIPALEQEALNDPDIKYNSKWYSFIVAPCKYPSARSAILGAYHPKPVARPTPTELITLPVMVGTPWVTRLYIWGTFEAWEHCPSANKHLMTYPPGFPSRPFVSYHDEVVRWHDYWLKGIDNGVMDEPPVKIFVMGVNKWKFEKEWPLARTKWTKYYLQPRGGLSTQPARGGKPDSFTQPAYNLGGTTGPIIYSLRYSTGKLHKDMEVTGPLALYLDASIDIDDTNWLVDLVDVAPDGNRQWVSTGYLKAKFRATDPVTSKSYRPVHVRQDPVPVPPGAVFNYAIAMMPTSVIFQKGHEIELIIRNQDDLLSRLGTWGIYFLPFMRTVTHNIYFGENTYLYVPVCAGYPCLSASQKRGVVWHFQCEQTFGGHPPSGAPLPMGFPGGVLGVRSCFLHTPPLSASFWPKIPARNKT